MAQIVAPTRNPFAPRPAMPSVALQTRRGVTVAPTPSPSPVAAVAPPAAPAPGRGTYAPIKAAMQAYQEPGDPFTAAAQGWINASERREEDAFVQGKRDQVAQAISGHPDLARFVESGVMDPTDAVRIAGDRDAATKKTEAETTRKAQISEYLRKSGDTAVADQFDAGVLQEDDIYEAIKGADPEKGTDDMREYQLYVEQENAAGREPMSFIDYMQGIKKAGATTVNTGDGSTAYRKKVDEGFAETYLKIQDEAKAGRRALNSFDVMEQTLSDPKFYSGIGGDQSLQLKRLGRFLGLQEEGVTSMEAFNALSKQAALDVMGGSLGTGFSNADRDFVIGQVPNLGNTKEGNQSLIEIQRRLATRKIEIAELATQYEQEHGQLDSGFDAYLSDWAETNPLFQPGEFGAPGAKQPSTEQPVTITDDAGYDALPSGQEFIAPDGTRRKKP